MEESPSVALSLTRKTCIVCACVLAFTAIGGLLFVARQIAMLVFGGILFAVVVQRLATFIGGLLPWQTERAARIAVVLIAGVALLSIVLTFSAGSISSQAVAATRRVDQAFQEVWKAVQQNEMVSKLSQDVSIWTSLAPSTQSLGMAKSLFASAFGMLADVLVLLILTIYFCVSPETYRVGMIRLMPLSWRDRASDLFRDSADMLWRWMLGRWLAMALVGGAFGAGLAVIGIPMPVELGVFAAIVTFIPNLGGVAAVIPALLLAANRGVSPTVAVLALYLAIQFAESYLITPLVQQWQVELPPAMVILAQLIAGILFGFWGIVFATPLVAVALLWTRQLYVEEWLETDPVN